MRGRTFLQPDARPAFCDTVHGVTESSPSHRSLDPSPWVVRFVSLIPAGGVALDLACGYGRHSRLLADRGYKVEAVDRDPEAIAFLSGVPGVTPRVADLEGGPWLYAGHHFDGIVVTNYLHRPLLPLVVDALAPAGVLIYETFAVGNEKFGRPSNPDFLLRPGELLDAVRGRLKVIAFEDQYVDVPKPAMVQRTCAVGRDHPLGKP